MKLYKPHREKLKFGNRHIDPLCCFASSECGLTDKELQLHLNTTDTNARWRRLELVEMGLVEKTKGTRYSPNGRIMFVYQVTEKGRKLYQSKERK